MLLLVVSFALLVEEWHVAHFCFWDISMYSANIFVVSARFVKTVGTVFHPVRKQLEISGCLLVI